MSVLKSIIRNADSAQKSEKLFKNIEKTVNGMGKIKKADTNHENHTNAIMVERFIESNSGTFKRKLLWQNLPKKIPYTEYKKIIDNLIESNKIITDKKGFICWIPVSKSSKSYTYDDNLIILEK